jgi:hypothetical protein
MGDKERSDELASGSRRRGAGNKVEEAIQPKVEKDEAEDETGDDSSDFHVNVLA